MNGHITENCYPIAENEKKDPADFVMFDVADDDVCFQLFQLANCIFFSI